MWRNRPKKKITFTFFLCASNNNIWIFKKKKPKYTKHPSRNRFFFLYFYIYSNQSEHTLASRNHLFICYNVDLEWIYIKFLYISMEHTISNGYTAVGRTVSVDEHVFQHFLYYWFYWSTKTLCERFNRTVRQQIRLYATVPCAR